MAVNAPDVIKIRHHILVLHRNSGNALKQLKCRWGQVWPPVASSYIIQALHLADHEREGFSSKKKEKHATNTSFFGLQENFPCMYSKQQNRTWGLPSLWWTTITLVLPHTERLLSLLNTGHDPVMKGLVFITRLFVITLSWRENGLEFLFLYFKPVPLPSVSYVFIQQEWCLQTGRK